jgi:hypothetical protein
MYAGNNGQNHRLVLANPCANCKGQNGFDFSSHDQMLTPGGFAWTLDHDTKTVGWAPIDFLREDGENQDNGSYQKWRIEYSQN